MKTLIKTITINGEEYVRKADVAIAMLKKEVEE